MLSKFIIFPLIVFSLSQSYSSERGDHEKRRPPEEAIEACKDKSSGASCSFNGRNNKQLSGTCFTPSSDKPLACKPQTR